MLAQPINGHRAESSSNLEALLDGRLGPCIEGEEKCESFRAFGYRRCCGHALGLGRSYIGTAGRARGIFLVCSMEGRIISLEEHVIDHGLKFSRSSYCVNFLNFVLQAFQFLIERVRLEITLFGMTGPTVNGNGVFVYVCDS